jgi:hypothetical protein
LHDTTFGYLNPTADQKDRMVIVRSAAADYAKTLERELPDGPDKTYILRTLRTVAMWANVTITRHPDGSPRDHEPDPVVKEYPMDHPAPGDLGSVPL